MSGVDLSDVTPYTACDPNPGQGGGRPLDLAPLTAAINATAAPTSIVDVNAASPVAAQGTYYGLTVHETANHPALVYVYDGTDETGRLIDIAVLGDDEIARDSFPRGVAILSGSLFVAITGNVEGFVRYG